ncbi:MAG: F0F1 ATP synthase subunit epsilon [Desulfobacterales bacterium]|nr:F0F1 ATP synthase subunit epsilon [Deltaproteobacteria bacterium]NNL76552.1 F0F1 ATP synthase subunit epsilon [Desulfobacterales bacterium]
MAENIRIEVVTPEKEVVNALAQIVMAPGNLGEFGVLDGHTPFMTSLKTGTMHYRDEKGADRYVFVSGGFAEALPNKVTVLAESAERMEDIDPERAKAALERAEQRLADDRAKEKIDITRARAALERALVRIKLAGSVT